MGKIIRFYIDNGIVIFGKQTRKSQTNTGCNEPYKKRYWCPKKKWFLTSPCSFTNKYECQEDPKKFLICF
jgi:hypothetical protein